MCWTPAVLYAKVAFRGWADRGMGGSGDYRFVPNADFAAALRGTGYAIPSDDEQFTMLLSGVT
jgi:hypothetical protein